MCGKGFKATITNGRRLGIGDCVYSSLSFFNVDEVDRQKGFHGLISKSGIRR